MINGYAMRKEIMTEHHPQAPQSPEDITKRDFLKGLFITLGGFLTLGLTWPFVSYLIPDANTGSKDDFVKVPNFKAVPIEKPTKLTFEYLDEQAFMKRKVFYDVWVLKHAEDKATVYSPLCPHLNCHYDLDTKDIKFVCPCHNSQFDMTGKLLGGPSPRGLDSLPSKVEGGELFVKWELFKPGIEAKVEA
jgi:Rieske Fe-S protein